jgi:cytochrome o ubiquinol oxidase operon protein cyoD
VHLIFFLHLDMSEEQRWNTISIAFSAVIMFVLVGGTIWLFYSLKFRMMVGY